MLRITDLETWSDNAFHLHELLEHGQALRLLWSPALLLEDTFAKEGKNIEIICSNGKVTLAKQMGRDTT